MKESPADSSEKTPQASVADPPASDQSPDAIAAERDRLLEERAETLEYANTESVRAILPILDDFERALRVEATGPEYARGMELIYQRLGDALKKLGLESITSKGQKFDPHVHHAVDMVETDEVDDHTILDEYQRGYNFRGRPLRPAMVKVAVKKQ